MLVQLSSETTKGQEKTVPEQKLQSSAIFKISFIFHTRHIKPEEFESDSVLACAAGEWHVQRRSGMCSGGVACAMLSTTAIHYL